MVTQHKDHTCKECKHRLPSFMALLKHIAQQHAKEVGEKDQEKLFTYEKEENKKKKLRRRKKLCL